MSLLIDFSILALLAGVLAYAWLVDRRVRRLVALLRDLEPVVGAFSAAVDKSEDSVSAMKSVADSLETMGQRKPEFHRSSMLREDPAPAFRSSRHPSARPAGVASVSGKADLVRSFFDTVRSREA
ncbi:flagellar motor switch protein [Albibacillus kandeliae]|uniref:flagellar motor switch protein n=1 Tax=Albibacillus kandeliae TaxID=2174228 RepID=UPI000D697B88|nr:flagellar motor switch protein [Albibacillus kandeliae]